MTTLLNADVAALRLWFAEKEGDAKSFASDVRIQGAIIELAQLDATNAPPEALAKSPSAGILRLYLKPLLETKNYLDYVVLSPDRRILASPSPEVVGLVAPRQYDMFLRRALDGRLTVSRPFVPQRSSEGPMMFVAAPVRSDAGIVVAVLALRMSPQKGFSEIFSVAHMGETGEAYAFDLRGMMLTASRFDAELKRFGLIPNTPEATSILTLRLLDPGADLEHGEVATRLRSDQPLTRMAAAAVLGDDGVDVSGYRNYRGTRVVGAWAWLPEYGMGVATEVSAAEAFQMLQMLREAFFVLFGLLVLSGVALFGFGLLVERMRSSVRRSVVAARRLGQYVLVQEIGRGANGMVYRARHSLLRRPVAIKLLSPDMTNETTAARFEHEVQMTSQLSHPNTVSIYDYGHTPEGLFYYAMEYLSGIDLDELVRRFGPQPEGRVIHILRQACGSLAEAHRTGLIHRDIKPANIVLTRRGGVCDVVKVLDFGLAQVRHGGGADSAIRKAVVGTPHFMPPEAVKSPENVDVRSDLYSLGAVGYWLLVGKTLFETRDVEELLDRQVSQLPGKPSDRLKHVVSADLESLIMRCLSKSPWERPASAEVLEQELARCASAAGWPPQAAQAWWNANLANIEAMPVPKMPEKTLVIAPRP